MAYSEYPFPNAPSRVGTGFVLEFKTLEDAEALLMDLHAAVDGWKGIVRPSKPLTRSGRLLARLGLRRA